MLSKGYLWDAEALEYAALCSIKTRAIIKNYDDLSTNIYLTDELNSVCRKYAGSGTPKNVKTYLYGDWHEVSMQVGIEFLKTLSLAELKQIRIHQHYKAYEEQSKMDISTKIVLSIYGDVWKVRFLKELCECYEKYKSRRSAKNMFINKINADEVKDRNRLLYQKEHATKP